MGTIAAGSGPGVKILNGIKNNQVEIYYLEHNLAINDIRVAFTISAKSLGNKLKWIFERELKA